ncbi:unnamed protein product, partial [Symbiodinium sp. CCMP2456]
LKLCTMNVNGAGSSFEALRVYTEMRTDIMVFQETHLEGHRLATFSAEAKRRGYRVWSVPAQTGRDSLGRGTINGGLAVAVKDGLPAFLVNSVSEAAGEALVLQCGQWRVCGLWQRPALVSVGLLTQHVLEAASAGYAVLALGDFNHLPSEGPLVIDSSATAFAASESGGYIPTRWQSERCIDFLQVVAPQGSSVSPSPCPVSVHSRVDDFALSDHRAALFRLPVQLRMLTGLLASLRSSGLRNPWMRRSRNVFKTGGVVCKDGPTVASTDQGAVDLLVDFWSHVWLRARSASGTAPGPSGWRPEELCDAPEAAFADLASLLNEALRAGCVPSVWQEALQVHLPKEPGATCDVEKLRPITVQCAVWRTVGRAIMHRPQTRAWVSRWVPDSFHGGVSGRDVFSALCAVEEDTIAGQHCVASLDLAKAFDWVDPSELCLMLEFLGFHPGVCQWLRAVWVQQSRWLSWRHAVSKEAHWAGSSLPQGDPFSPMGMMVYLAAVARNVSQTVPRVRLSFYADDRNLAARCANTLLDTVELVTDWTRRLGLQENRRKLAVLPRTQEQRTVFERRVPDRIVTSVRLLGTDLGQRRGQADRSVDGFTGSWHLGLAGVSRSVGSSTSTYWRLYKAAVKGHSVGSADLIRLLDGHYTDPCYTAGQAALSHLWRCWQNGYRQLWTLRPLRGTWQGRVREHLAQLGWTEVGPWAWSHPAIGDISFAAQQALDRQRGLHSVRESWRRARFQSFLGANRRDSRELRTSGAVYSEARVKAVSKHFQSCSAHERAVLVGAACSLAFHQARDAAADEDFSACSFCLSGSIGSWRHLCWECPHFAGTRPAVHMDPLTERLGWPSFDAARGRWCWTVLHHMACVRAALLGRA